MNRKNFQDWATVIAGAPSMDDMVDYLEQFLQSELESERAKVREKEWALIKLDTLAKHMERGREVRADEFLAITNVILTKPFAPTEAEIHKGRVTSKSTRPLSYDDSEPNREYEAEIRAQRDREIADWLDGKAENITGGPSEILAAKMAVNYFANELRQRAGHETK